VKVCDVIAGSVRALRRTECFVRVRQRGLQPRRMVCQGAPPRPSAAPRDVAASAAPTFSRAA